MTRSEQEARSRDSIVAVTRPLAERLRDEAETPEDRALWNQALAELAEWDQQALASMAALRAGREAEALRIRDTGAIAARDRAQAAAQIQASAGQQAAGMVQIRQAMGNIHEATQQNLASTRQAERAAQDLNALGGKLLALVGGNHGGPPRTGTA